jgi:hypothetical protein
MPKNIFRKPAIPAKVHNVPRHGAPLPVKKLEARKVLSTKQDIPVMPSLDTLLGKD